MLSLQQYSKEQLQELSLIEMAYELLRNRKEAISFSDLLAEVTKLANLSEDTVRARIAQFYTDLNIDGRFLALGDNRWGLRVWYPVDTQEEEVVTVIKPKKKKAKKVVDEDDLEDFEELDEEEFEDLEEFEEDDVLDDEEDFEEIDEVDEFEEDEDEVLEEDEEFELDEEEELDEDLEEEDEEEL